MSRWPPSGTWCAWTSRATSGRSSSLRPTISSGCSASTSTKCSPTARCPIQIAEQIELGRTLIVELDSWYLPDTATTSYRAEHVKTSVAADAIDLENETLRYFHSGGLFELSGEDYRGVFRIGEYSDDVLPPYTELRALRCRPEARRRRAAPGRPRAPAPGT